MDHAVDMENPAKNVWVMITKGQADENKTVQSLRVFSHEPHPTMVEYQQQLFAASYQAVEVVVLEVNLDYFDMEELVSYC